MSTQNIGTTILAGVVALGLLFIAPMVTLTGRADKVTQENVQLIVDEFVTEVANTGKLTRTNYENFESKLNSTGNLYDIEIEIHHLDENPGKKTAQTNYTKIGENVYYTEYAAQILPQIGIDIGSGQTSTGNKMILKQGDIIKIRVKNTNATANQTLESSALGFSNADEYVIEASSSAMVTVNGIKD